MTNQPTSVTTGRVRLSYVNVFQPREDMSGRKKYSVTLLIPKTDTATVQRINDAIEAAKKKGRHHSALSLSTTATVCVTTAKPMARSAAAIGS